MSKRLTLDKCGDDWDWYALHWDNFGRVNGASIEGDANEWRQIADAIERGESIGFKRVAFDKHPDGPWFVSSPRNSMSPTRIEPEEVLALVPVIREAIAAHDDTAEGGSV